MYNVLRKERPDVLRTLIEPIWYFDRKGEVSKGEEPYIRSSVFYLENDGGGRVFSKYGSVVTLWLDLSLTVLDGIRITFVPSLVFPIKA